MQRRLTTVLAVCVLALWAPAAKAMTLGDDGLLKQPWFAETFL